MLCERHCQAQVQASCEGCGKLLNKKSLARHLRDVHGRKNSVSSLACDFDEAALKATAEKRKAGTSLSPLSTEPLPKDVKVSPPATTDTAGDSGSPKLRSGSGSKGSQ